MTRPAARDRRDQEVPYAELHAHSAFSFLDGASHPEELAAEGERLGLKALAITDHDGLYGVVRFSEAAKKIGLPTAFGAELHLPTVSTGTRGVPVLDPPTGIPDPRATHLLVLARGPQGYRNLSSAIGTAHLEAGVKGAAHYTLETLGEAAAGEWLVLTGCRKGAVRQALTSPLSAGYSPSQNDSTGQIPSTQRGGNRSDRLAAGRRELQRLVDVFGRENVAVEISATGDPRDADLHAALALLAQEARLPLVATTAAHYARPRDADLAGALAAVRARSSLDDLDGWLPGAPTAHLRSGAEMARLHRLHPQAVATAAALGAECAFDLKLIAPNLPPYPVPPGHDEASWLRELTHRGATGRYGSRESNPKAWAQIDHELKVITDLNFPGYFLVVYDLVEFCRTHGILAQGRGSAANSAVCFALGITAVDAVKHKLLFERFLAPERDGPPDIDIDIESVRREEVIQHVYERFGRTHAAQVANVISYRPRSAVRDAARALGYDVGQQDAWSKSIERWGTLKPRATVPPSGKVPEAPVERVETPAGSRQTRVELVETSAGSRQARPAAPQNRTAAKDARMTALWGPGENGVFVDVLAQDVRIPGQPRERADDTHDVVPFRTPPSAAQEGEIPDDVLDLADRMLRLPRHLGIHSGGMVMCDRPVIEVVPVEWARMEGRTVLQWDKEDCADAELVKFDLLGLGMLTAIRYAFEFIEEQTGERPELHGLPQEDPAVYDLLCAADTVGVFQVESRAQMATLPRLRPRTFYDIVVEVALIRPGPIQGGSVHPYIERARGREKVEYLHPLLENSLSRTLGVPLFQEQLMQMAIDVAGFSGKEADQLRRAMGSKRSVERMEALRARLFAGMTANDVPGDVQEEIFEKLKAFADFGFPESHAYSFAYLVYASSWLKVYHPAAFYAGLLAAQPMGFYSPQSLVADARRHGVRVLRPSVAASRVLSSVERMPVASLVEPVETSSVADLVHADPTLVVRMGLESVRGIGKDKAEEIVAARDGVGQDGAGSDGVGPGVPTGDDGVPAGFASLRDLVQRVELSTAQLEALATGGALEPFGVERREGLWAAGALGQEGPTTLPGVSVGVEAPTLPGMSEVELSQADAWATGVTPDSYPTQHVRPGLETAGVLTVAQAMVTEPGRRVAVGGVVTHRQRPGTAGGVTFLSLEDETGLLNVICTVGLWQRLRRVARSAQAMVIRGRIEAADGAVNLLAEHLAPLSLAVPGRSRDFR
ncbi:PHP domain-containing protein [Promicromonospora sukumoe]|uniref:PHP domain-containing protein n=1 Tax=Promicromonospora sukumoe TaxID=88382 RepID=UPI0015FB46C4|nr:PHP domain-containing protein [Promicromonospora sukumoe]